jgi:hypothetical protein
MPQPVDLYVWRNAIASVNGPQNPQTRLTLLVLSLHMRSDGTGAWPSQAFLAKRTGQCRRTIIEHLADAELEGWIVRTTQRRGQVKTITTYEATVPDDVYNTLPERPWESDPTWRRGESVAPPRSATNAPAVTRNVTGSASDDRKVVQPASEVVQLTAGGGATGVIGGATDDHRNSSSNSSRTLQGTLPREGALSRTPGVLEDAKTKAEEVRHEGAPSLETSVAIPTLIEDLKTRLKRRAVAS